MDAHIGSNGHKFQPIRSRIKKSRWRRPRKSAMLENSPQSLDRGPGIGLTDFHGNTNHGKVTPKMSCNFKLDTVSCGPKRQKSIQQAAMMKTERELGPSSDYREASPKHHGTMISSGTNQRKEIRMNQSTYSWASPVPLS